MSGSHPEHLFESIASWIVSESLTSDSDAEYLVAVEAEDTDKCQKMVDAAAKAAGFTVGPVWHGTRNGYFTKFKLGGDANAIFLSTSKEEAEAFVGSTLFGALLGPFYINIKHGKRLYHSTQELGAAKSARRHGMTGFQVTDDYTVSRMTMQQQKQTINYAVFNPSQIKSAESVTYDDTGHVILLSKRFDPKSQDVREGIDEGAFSRQGKDNGVDSGNRHRRSL